MNWWDIKPSHLVDYLLKLNKEDRMLVINHQKEYNRGLKKMDSLILKAIRIRDTKGYHENLGYEFSNKLSDYLGTLNLSYQEEADILSKWFNACDNI